jgi:paraquat-inducible protein A
MSAHCRLSVCHDCDTLQAVPPLPPGGSARCVRCRARLCSNPRGGLETPLALAAGAMVLFLTANFFPLLALEIQGRSQATSFTGAALTLAREGMPELGLVVWLTCVLVPGAVFGITLYVLVAVHLGRRLPLLRPLVVLLSRLRPWGMLDVFMLGILVAMVKLADLASILPGAGLFAFLPLILFSAGIAATLEPRLLWDRLDALQ